MEKITLKSLGPVTRIVAVICPNKYKIHKGIYVRYLILVNADGHAVFLDDPSPEDCKMIYDRSSHEAEVTVVESDCQFCQSEDSPLHGGNKSS